jgi:hypothetical protein
MKLSVSLVASVLGQYQPYHNQGYQPYQPYQPHQPNQGYQPYQPYNQGYQPYNQGYQNQGYNQGYQPYNNRPHNGNFGQGQNNFGQNNGYQQNQPDCFEPNADIDGNFFRTNVVANLHSIGSAKLCQQECQRQASQGCEYFVWESVTRECALYTDIDQLEHDDDDDEGKILGPGYGCLPCYKPGWDYVQTGSGQNLVQYGEISDVSTTQKCAMICSLVPECSFWTHESDDNSCELFKGSAQGSMESDYDYNSGTRLY